MMRSIRVWTFVRRGTVLAMATALWPTVAFAQSYTWRNVPIVGGGFIPGIVFNTAEPNLIYARTDIGGAYRWSQSTRSWIPLMDWVAYDDWNLTGVDSLATDPVDPDRLYVLAGTYTNSWTNMNGAVLRSLDRGNTFPPELRTPLPFKSGGNMPGRNMGERLAIDPNSNNILYLGARSGNGLWRSTNFGASFSRVASFTAVGNYIQDPGDPNGYLSDRIGVTWIVFDPRTRMPDGSSRNIYVGVADLATSVYRSTDGGATWSALPGQPTGFMAHHGVLASNGILYLTYNNKGGPYDGEKGDVWKLDTGTGAWTLISPVPSTSPDDYFGYGGLAVDAQLPNVVMVSALNSWWPDTMIWRSTNGGATWTRIWDFASGTPSGRSFRYTQDISASRWLTFGVNPPPPEVTPKLGWMVGDLEIDPFNSNRMMYGTGATLYGSEDLTTWDTGGQIRIQVMAQGIEETSVQDLISPPTGAPLLSALGDINGFRHDSLTAVPPLIFTAPNTSSSTSIDYAELMQNFIVRVGNVDKQFNPNVNRVGFSFDGGTSWFQGGEPGGVTGGGTVAAAANGSRVVWSPQGAAVHFSTNNGSSWTPSAGIPAGAIVESDRVNPMKFYGFVNGAFYVSTNGGANFAASAATGLPTAGAHARFRAVPGREGDVWLAGGTEGGVYGLWRSTNSGASFTKLASVEEADNIGFGMPASGQTYPALYASAQVGGVRGIYRSVDAGASWLRINDDAHQYASTNAAITGDPRVFGRVYVSTNGRGIILGEPSGVQNPDFSLSANPPSLTVARGASGTSAITITRLNGFTAGVALSASGLPSGVTATFSPASTTGGSSTLTLAASGTATLGAATVTVSGTGGALTRATTINLTVNAPDFTLAPSPSSLTLNRGASGMSTVTLTRTGGLAAAVAFSASGLPSGMTATFNPTSTTANTTTVTLAASSTATLGAATVSITGSGGGLTRSTTINLTVNAPDFALGTCNLSVARGNSGTCTVGLTRSGGFTGSVAFSASGLPAGVTAAFNPTSTTGNSTVLTLTASGTAALGTSTVTVTGTGGGLTRTTAVSLTVTDIQPPNFVLSAAPASVTANRGAMASTTINVARTNFTGAVALSGSGLPSGVTLAFNPASATGGSSTATFSASATAALGTSTVTITGTGGGLTRTTTVSLTVNDVGNGGVTMTPAVPSRSPWFNEQVIRLSNTAPLTALSITIVIQRTTGLGISGQYNTVGGQIQQTSSSTATALTYQFTLAAGQTLGTGTDRVFAAQTSGNGTPHPTTGDSFTVTYTTGGTNFTRNGTFP